MCNLDVGLNSKQKQRQDTNGFRCNLHLLTLELINTLYLNFEDKTVDKNWRKTLERNPIIIKMHLMTLHSFTFKYLYDIY